MADKTPNSQARVRHDLIWVITVTLVCSTLWVLVDAFDELYERTRAWEKWELDEVFPSIFVLALCLIWFLYRRWRDADAVSERKQAEEALRQEKEKSESLLLNVLPRPIANRLKQGAGTR